MSAHDLSNGEMQMLCPDCEIPMNRHAEKLLKEKSDESPEEQVISVHCCPGCGKTESEVEPSEQASDRRDLIF